MLLKTAVGWVITLIVAGIGGGLLVAQAIHAPMSDGQQAAFLAQIRRDPRLPEAPALRLLIGRGYARVHSMA